jgi:hypothetical protein
MIITITGAALVGAALFGTPAGAADGGPQEDTTAHVCDVLVNMIYGPTNDADLEVESGTFEWTYSLVDGGNAGCYVSPSWGIHHFTY